MSQQSADTHGIWPVVSAADWCGHFSKDTVAAGNAD